MSGNREGSSPLPLASSGIQCPGGTTCQKGLMELLQLVQNGYSRAKQQLEEVYEVFSNRETTVNQQIQAMLTAGGIATQLIHGREAVQDVDDVAVNRQGLAVPSQTLVSRSAISFRVYCLGRFEVYSGQNKVDQWRSLKAKSLLKFLVAHRGRYIPKDVLMEALWPGYPPEAANNNLKAAVYALRQTISYSGLEPGRNNRNGFLLLMFSEGFTHCFLCGPRESIDGKCCSTEHWLLVSGWFGGYSESGHANPPKPSYSSSMVIRTMVSPCSISSRTSMPSIS